MAQNDHTPTYEAVGLFHDPDRLNAAIAELGSSGFERADMSLLAREGILEEHAAKSYGDTHRATDDPEAPREAVVADTDIRQQRTLGTSLAAAVAALAASGITIVTGGAALAAFAAAAAAGGTAAVVGEAIGSRVGKGRSEFLKEQIARGGIVLWVKTRDVERERKACEILARHGGTAVHVQDTPTT